MIELPVLLREGARASKSYEGVSVPAVCVSVPVILTTGHCARRVHPAPVVTFSREKSVPIKLSVTEPDVRVYVRDVEYVFCVVVHAVSVPDAVCVIELKALPQPRSAEVIVRPTHDQAETDAHHAKEPPDGVCHVATVPLVAVNTCPFVGAVAALTDTVVVALFRASAYQVVFWLSVGKVQFVRVPDVGVPSTGVTSVGLVANTRAHEPVSSLITHFNSSEVVAAN